MAQPSSRRILATVAAAAASLTLAAAVAAPAVAGASTHKHRARSHGALVKVVASKEFGKILVDASGRTLYFLDAANKTPDACTGSCTGLWPPLMTKGKPRAGKGLARKKLGTAKRGARLQVTYDGHPLYLYAGDTGAGQVKGEGIASFGGKWYLLSGKGSPVKVALASWKKGSGGSGGYGGSSGSSGSSSSSGGW